MSADRPLTEKLGNFLKVQHGIGSERLRQEFVCPPEMLALQECFPLFEWSGIEGTDRTRVVGIRRLVDQTPFRLSDFRALGFRTESVRHPVRPPIAGGVEHYLIAELLAPGTARVSFCMYVPPQEWYVLDEHQLSR